MRTWQREHPWLSRMLMLMKAIKMTDMTGPGTTGDYKAQAKRLRSAMASQGTPISHSRALELIAEAHGARDWNTLAARTPALPQSAVRPATNRAFLQVGARVGGHYLGQPFTGEVLAVSSLGNSGRYKLEIHFDEPVDVVTFDSFSAFRRRIRATVDENGTSPQRTSNGQPHLVIETAG